MKELIVWFFSTVGFIFIIIYALIIYSESLLPWIWHCDLSFWLFYFFEDYLE